MMRLRLREVKQLRPSHTAGNGKYTKMLIVVVICGQYNDGFFFSCIIHICCGECTYESRGEKAVKK